MPVATNPLDAVVSIWDQPTTGPDRRPIGSGIFIAPQWVITARHVIEDRHNIRHSVWLGGVQDKMDLIRVDKKNFSLPDDPLDIALIKLDLPNNRQPWCRVDAREQDLKLRQVCLYGVVPNEKEATTITCEIMAYDEPHRYFLTNYAHARGYSGGVATIDNIIVGIITARYKDENQGVIVPVSAVRAWLEGFDDLRQLLVLRPTSFLPDASVAFIPQNEFTASVKSRIRTMLQKTHMQALRDALVQLGHGESAEDALVPRHAAPLVEAIDRLHRATKTILQALSGRDLDGIELTKSDIKELFGWLLVLLVDREQVQASGFIFDPWQERLQVAVPCELEAGCEVLVASLTSGDRARAAWLELKYDNKHQSRVVGRDSFTADDLEMGIGPTDQLTEILKRIWAEVRKPESPPVPFGDRELKRLQATLNGRERRGESHYYIAVPPDHGVSSLSNPALLERLLQALPSLRIIALSGEQGGGLLLLDEYELWESIEAFLQMLRDTP